MEPRESTDDLSEGREMCGRTAISIGVLVWLAPTVCSSPAPTVPALNSSVGGSEEEMEGRPSGSED